MYDHALHCGRKYFCWYCLQAFIIAEKLKCLIKNYPKINELRELKCHQIANPIESKIMREK